MMIKYTIQLIFNKTTISKKKSKTKLKICPSPWDQNGVGH